VGWGGGEGRADFTERGKGGAICGGRARARRDLAADAKAAATAGKRDGREGGCHSGFRGGCSFSSRGGIAAWGVRGGRGGCIGRGGIAACGRLLGGSRCLRCSLRGFRRTGGRRRARDFRGRGRSTLSP
jgi:hypothetical protein